MTKAELYARLAEKDAENAALHAHVRQLLGRLDELMVLVAKGNERIAELLVIAQRKKSKPRAAPKQPEQPEQPPVLDEAAHAFFDGRPTPPPAPGVPVAHPKPRPRPTGRKPLPGHLPVDETTTRPERCPCGCGTFDWVDEVIEEKLDVVAHQRRRITHRKTGRCRACGQRSTGEAPPSPFLRSKVTCEWLAWLVVQKFQLLTPLDRIRRYLGAQGVVLAQSFLVTQITAAADLLDVIDGEHWRTLKSGDTLATDATGLKVMVPGVGLHHGHVEVYHHNDVVVFQYEAEKGAETQSAKLATFQGALLVDAEARYGLTIRTHEGIVEGNCNAHPRRKLRDAEGVQPRLAVEGGRFVSAMFEAEADAQALGLTGDALRARRQEHIRPIAEDLRRWMDAVEPTLVPSDLLAKVIRYYRNHWTELTRFIDDARLAIDNSGSEREFQSFAKLRLNMLFAGGTEGAHRACVLLGISATCRRLGVDLGAYLTWVFVRRGTHAERYQMSAAELTPAAYKRAHPGPAG